MKQCDFSFFLPFFFIYCISILYGLLVLLFVFPLIQAERFFHNTIKINYTFALAVISSIKIRTIRQTKVPT